MINISEVNHVDKERNERHERNRETRDSSTKVISLADIRETKVAVDYDTMSRDDALLLLVRTTPSKISMFKVDKLKQFCKALGVPYKGTKSKTSALLLELREQHVPNQ